MKTGLKRIGVAALGNILPYLVTAVEEAEPARPRALGFRKHKYKGKGGPAGSGKVGKKGWKPKGGKGFPKNGKLTPFFKNVLLYAMQNNAAAQVDDSADSSSTEALQSERTIDEALTDAERNTNIYMDEARKLILKTARAAQDNTNTVEEEMRLDAAQTKMLAQMEHGAHEFKDLDLAQQNLLAAVFTRAIGGHGHSKKGVDFGDYSRLAGAGGIKVRTTSPNNKWRMVLRNSPAGNESLNMESWKNEAYTFTNEKTKVVDADSYVKCTHNCDKGCVSITSVQKLVDAFILRNGKNGKTYEWSQSDADKFKHSSDSHFLIDGGEESLSGQEGSRLTASLNNDENKGYTDIWLQRYVKTKGRGILRDDDVYTVCLGGCQYKCVAKSKTTAQGGEDQNLAVFAGHTRKGASYNVGDASGKFNGNGYGPRLELAGFANDEGPNKYRNKSGAYGKIRWEEED